MTQYSIEQRTRKYVKGYGLSLFAREYKIKQLLDTGLDAVKTASKKVVHKAGELLGDETADAVTKTNDYKILKLDENPRNVEEMIIPPEKSDEILNKLREVL